MRTVVCGVDILLCAFLLTGRAWQRRVCVHSGTRCSGITCAPAATRFVGYELPPLPPFPEVRKAWFALCISCVVSCRVHVHTPVYIYSR